MTSSEMKRWLAKQGAQLGEQKGSHLKVYVLGRSTVLPMHPSKELATGTVNAIKKQLGLK
jgi:mRNA interferase HicA